MKRSSTASASSSRSESSASGQAATASSPRSPGSSVQISSVTNGITGWSSTRIRSSEWSRTAETRALSSS